MDMARIAPAEAPYEPSITQSFARIMPSGREPLKLFHTMARNPRILQRLFVGSLLGKGSIGLRDREIVILRTCARCRSEYEWGVHVAVFAEEAGLSREEIGATRMVPTRALWSDRDRSLIALVDELHDGAAVSDVTWNSLMQHYSEEQALELRGCK
jgi:alkylhydroperoxidase family enzyme